MIVDCYCGDMAVGLVGEDGIPLCLGHYCEELEEYAATLDIASQAMDLAERRVRVRWLPIDTLDSGGLL